MDARLRVARLAMGLALVGEVGEEIGLALQHAAGRGAAGVEAPLEIVGDTGRDLLGIGLVEGLAETAEEIVDSVARRRAGGVTYLSVGHGVLLFRGSA